MHTEPDKSRFRQILGSKKHFNKIGKRYVYQTVCISIFLITLASSVLCKSNMEKFRHYLTDMQHTISAPLSYIKDKINIIQNVLSSDYSTNLQQLQQENLVLKHTVATLSQKLSDEEAVKHLTAKIKQKSIPAKVVNLIVNQYTAHLTINRGQKDGISKNDFVLNETGLIGRITDIGDDWSTVLLTIDANFQLPIRFKSNDKMAIIKGSGRSTILTDVKNGNFAIQENDEVITSGYGGLYVEGLLVGRSNENGEIFPCYDVNKLRIVCVIGHIPF